jgi:hypothetical protein
MPGFTVQQLSSKSIGAFISIMFLAAFMMTSTNLNASDDTRLASATPNTTVVGHEKHGHEQNGTEHNHLKSHCHTGCQAINPLEQSHLILAVYAVQQVPTFATHQHQYSSAPPLRPPK